MHLCVFEDDQVGHLLPLVHTRAVYDLRLGRRTLLETLRDAWSQPPTVLHARRQVTAVTAQEHDVPVNDVPEGADVLFVNGRYLAEPGAVLDRLLRASTPPEPARVFVKGTEVVAAWIPAAGRHHLQQDALTAATFEGVPEERVDAARLIGRLWHLIDELPAALRRDYAAGAAHFNVQVRTGVAVHPSAVLIGEEQIYTAPGVTIRPGAILNAEHGPIYLDAGAAIMEQAVLRGPCYVGPHTQVKAQALLEAVAVGPWSKVGGAVHDSVVQGYTNKAHAGFMGHSYLGRWCNLGAGTVTSNLKNDYTLVTLYNAATGANESTGRQFVGLFMGDHAKSGIGTTFNTGTVVGVSCNIYGAGFPPRHLPSFSWGSPGEGYVPYRLGKALQVAEAVMARRNQPFTEAHRSVLTAVFEATQAERAAMPEGNR